MNFLTYKKSSFFRSLMVSFTLLSMCGVPRVQAADTYSGTVTEVSSSGSFLFKTSTKEYSFLLYGIDFSPLNAQEYENFKEFLSEKVLGKPANVVVVRDLSGFKFVRLLTPDDMAMKVIEEGLAPWDSGLASKETVYKEMEEAAKESELGIWGSAPVKNNNPFNLSRQQRLDYRRQIRSLNFEVMLDRWSGLDVKGRAWYRENVQWQLAEGQNENKAVLSQLRAADDRLGEKQIANGEIVQENMDNVSDSLSSEEDLRDEVYDDESLNTNAELLDVAIDAFGEPRIRNSPYGGKYFDDGDALVMDLHYKLKQDQDRVNSEANQISQEHEEDRAEYYEEMRRVRRANSKINAQRKRNQGLDEALSTNVRFQHERLNKHAGEISRLDEALKQKYVYASTFSAFINYPTAKKGDELFVPASLRFTVVTWDGTATYSGIDVYRGPERQLLTRLLNNKPAYKRFIILEPGYEYLLKPKASGRINMRYLDLKDSESLN